MPWTGRRKVAFIPVYRPHATPPDLIPADWPGDILRRVLYDPDPTTGADRSVRTYIQKASSGRADLDAVVLPTEVIDQQGVPVDALEGKLGATLRRQGYAAAALVMLGGVGAGTAQPGGFWARFVMVEKLGTWAHELIHCLTGFHDLYPFSGNMGAFDQMACACGTHPSAFTKSAIRWLDHSAIAQHTSRAASYDLHAVGLTQPPPAGRWAAVRIGALAPYLVVEARLRADQFESPSQQEPGIPSQGVIVYRVQTRNPLGTAENNTAPVALLTATALQPGGAFTADTGVKIQVVSALSGGFSVSITDPRQSGLYTIQQQSNNRFVDAHEIEDRDHALVTRPAQANDTQWWILTPLGDNTYTIQQKSSGRFVDAHEVDDRDFALVTRTAQNNDTQRWILIPQPDGSYTIQQKSTGRFVDAHEVEDRDFAVITRPAQHNDTQRWLIRPL